MTRISNYVIDVDDKSLQETIRNIGTFSARANVFKQDITATEKVLDGFIKQGKKGSIEYRNMAETLGQLTAAQKLNEETLKANVDALKLHSKEAIGSVNSYAAMKVIMTELQEEAEKLDLSLDSSRNRFKEIQEELADLSTKTSAFDKVMEISKGGIIVLTNTISDSFKAIGDGFKTASAAYGVLKGYTGEIDVIDEGIKKVEKGIATYSAVSQHAKGITTAFTTAQNILTAANGKVALSLRAIRVAIAANPIGAVIAAIAAVAAVASTFWKSSKEKAEDYIKSLDKLKEKEKDRVAEQEHAIEVLKIQGASEKEILEEKEKLLKSQKDFQDKSIDELSAKVKKSSGEAKDLLQQELDEAIRLRKKYENNIELNKKQQKANELKRHEDFKNAVTKIDEDLANLQNKNHIQLLKEKQARDLDHFKKTYSDQVGFEEALKNFQLLQLEEVNNAKKKIAADNNPVKILNEEISKLTDEVLTEMVVKGEASAKKLERLQGLSEKLATAQYKLSEATKEFNAALEQTKKADNLTAQMEEVRQQIEGEIALINARNFTDAEKAQKIAEAKLAASEKELDLLMQRVLLDNKVSDDEKKQIRLMEEKLSLAQKELDIITEGAKVNEFVGEGLAKEMTTIKTLADQKLKLLEQSHQQELNKEGLSKKERKELEEKFQAEKLDIQKDATQKQIEALKASLTALSAADKGVALEGLDDETKMQIQAITIEINTLKTALDGMEDGDEERTAQIQERAQEAADAFGKVGEALDVIGEISEARLQNELARIEEKREAEIAAVNASVLSEEEKKRRIEDINTRYDKQAEAKQKAAAKRDKAIAITKTIIAGAQAVAQGIAQFAPPPSPLGIAAIAAAAATTATQLALIAKQKFAKGGYIPFETGGMIQGASHAQGGVPFSVGGRLMEAEGGELVVNRNIWSRPDFVKNISEMNALTGGRRFFAAGGMVPSVSPPAYVSTANMPAEDFDNDMLVRGLRGVIAEEVGSLKVVNNVVDTTSQQQRLLNIQTEASF